MSEYMSLVEAQRTIGRARTAVSREDETIISPAWRMLDHAQEYVRRIAEAVLRAPEPERELPKIDYQERDYLSRVEPTPSAQEEEAESE